MTAEMYNVDGRRFTHAGAAISAACQFSPAGVVGWQSTHWIVYHPCARPPKGVQPEFLCIRGTMPLALSNDAADVLASLLISMAHHTGRHPVGRSP